MADGGYTILHRKDERGVIVESNVFGPDDEVPEGFGAVEYQSVYAPREDDQEPVAESKLTPWESPIAKGTWIEQDNEAVEEAVEESEQVEESEDDELDEGSPEQARDDLTDAEKEANESVEDSEADDSKVDETDAGSPAQQDGDDLPVPPKGGPGSGADVWAAYAASNGVEVEDDATRDEIIAACKARNVPVD